jgi:predicted HTH transcriptional regulator
MMNSWTEADLKALIGQTESIRREFKAGVMFQREPESKWVESLSKEVSALANTEGGELFLGVDEDKGRPRTATSIDGIPITLLAPERLQQLIEGNVSPYLPGIRVQRIKLSASPDRVAFVIQVPPGSTAYQAKDGRYYGRSEFEAKHLPDHEIRLRMNRGRIANAAIHLQLKRVVLGSQFEAELRAKHSTAIEALKADAADAIQRYPELLEIMAAKYHPDEISFCLVLKNEGELTIRNPAVVLKERRSERLSDNWTLQGSSVPSRLELQDETIFPADVREISGSHCHLRCKRDVLLSSGDYVFHWTVYLDNSPPSMGAIDVGALLQGARAASRSEP